MYHINLLLEEEAGPYYEQIYEQIRDRIRQGKIPSREKLPSTRTLSAQLSLARSTVQSAYDQLLAEGYIQSRPGSGYFVTELEGMETVKTDLSRQSLPGYGRGAFRQDQISAGTMPGREGSASRERGDKPAFPQQEKDLIDFSPRGVDEEHIPVATWKKLTREVLSEGEGQLFNSGDPQGEYPFREAICRYLREARGVRCTPEQLLIGAGSEYLLLILSQLLPEGAVIMEEYTYRQAGRVFQKAGRQVAAVSSDASGLRTEELRESPVLIYSMPSHQFPLGTVMPVKRRMELLASAGSRPDSYILEDDYDSEFRYRGKPIPALQEMDREGRVVYMGTFSRSIAPAIRISYLVLPPALLARYQEGFRFYSSTVSKVDQQVMTRFLQGGYFERHLNKMRKIYREKHDLLLEGLGRTGLTVTGENAGIHLLVTGRKGQTEEMLVEAAGRAGVKVYGLSQFRLEAALPGLPSDPGTVLLGYAARTPEEIREGVSRLQKAWQ